MLPAWKEFFEPAGPHGSAIHVRVLTRAGHPLLIIPRGSLAPNHAAFSLYAPQTLAGKAARMLWRWTMPFEFAPGSHGDAVSYNPASPFLKFLSSVAGSSQVPPVFSLLPGNPFGEAPRFIFLVFRTPNEPIAVVKAGSNPSSSRLIRKEADFLQKLQDSPVDAGSRLKAGFPALLGRFEQGNMSAFAMTFSPGESPDRGGIEHASEVLISWLHGTQQSKVADLAAWRRLNEACRNNPVMQALQEKLGGLAITPAIFHGDFVPWNIKVAQGTGSWCVIDWERGEWEGPPAWDWYHYVLQSAVLTDKKQGQALLKVTRDLLNDPKLLDYLGRTGLLQYRNEWLVAYLLYFANVLKPREGSPAIDWLLKRLTAS